MGSLIPDIASGNIKVAIGEYKREFIAINIILLTKQRTDRGGTFTDVWASAPGKADIVLKLLSVDPGNYSDAPTEGMLNIAQNLYFLSCSMIP